MATSSSFLSKAKCMPRRFQPEHISIEASPTPATISLSIRFLSSLSFCLKIHLAGDLHFAGRTTLAFFVQSVNNGMRLPLISSKVTVINSTTSLLSFTVNVNVTKMTYYEAYNPKARDFRSYSTKLTWSPQVLSVRPPLSHFTKVSVDQSSL